MDKYIAYCGLDCKSCEAYIATIGDDNSLRKKVAKKWSELNGVEITPEMINCEGCRNNGKKTVFCDSLCPIRQCAFGRGIESCGNCSEMEVCHKITMVTGTNKEALARLEKCRKGI